MVCALVPRGWLFPPRPDPQVISVLLHPLEEGFAHALEDGLCLKTSLAWLGVVGRGA